MVLSVDQSYVDGQLCSPLCCCLNDWCQFLEGLQLTLKASL